MNKTIKSAIVFLTLFSIAAVGITYFNIQKAADGTGSFTAEKETGIDLYCTYDENDLLIEEKIEAVNDVEIKIPQIKGLKDTDVQEKVNQDIYIRCQELVDTFEPINYAVYTRRANFANVLSISFNVGSDTGYDQVYLNYELVHGNELELEDLFMKDTDLVEIVRKAFYQSMVKDSAYTAEGKLTSPDENELYKAVKGYMEGEVQEFSFTPAEITFYYKDYVASVRMIDIADKVSVYSKYMTGESIFENDDIGFDDVFTCADTQYDGFELIDYGYLEPNFWYDVTAWQDWMAEEIETEKQQAYQKFKAEMFDAAYEKIEEYRKVAKENPDKFYIYFAKPSISLYMNQVYQNGEWDYTVSNAATVIENEYIYEMPMEHYETVFRDKLIDTYRYIYFAMRGGAYFYDTDGVEVTEIHKNRIYNYMTGEELTVFEDVFYADSGYMEVIENKIREQMSYQTDSSAYLDRLMETVEYRLEGDHIRATLPSSPDFYMAVYFDNFDMEMLKIFE